MMTTAPRLPLRLAALATLLLCTSSCKDVTHIQTGYVSDRSDCRSRAEYSASSYAGSTSISGKERSNMLLQLFCECMKDRQWNVAGCKYKEKEKEKDKAPTPQQPTIVVVQAPPAAAAVAAPAPAAECPIPPKSKTKKRPKRRIDGTCPAPEEYGQTELDQILNKAQ